MLDLTKLIPSNIRMVQRFVDLISAFQSYLYTEIYPKIQNFNNRSDITKVSLEDAKHMIWDKGHNLTTGDGYTSTYRYVQRHLQTLVKRLLTKSTHKAYQYLFYVYDLLGDTYPCIYKANGTLQPRLNWLASNDVNDPPIKLDEGFYLDQAYDDMPYWTLDAGDFVDFTTRHFIISYSPRYVEDTESIMSLPTCTAFFNDVKQTKRKVEIPHFEFRMYAEAPITGVDSIETWNSYDGTVQVNQHSIYILQYDIYSYPSTFNEAGFIQLGVGAHDVMDQTITGCADLVQQFNLSDFTINFQDPYHLYLKSRIYPYEKAFDYRELAVLDTTGNCIFYSKFPWVRFDPRMLSHNYLLLTLNI